MENNENKTSQTVLRVLVILGILAILVFLSIGIVRIVPRALNALANASVSITSLFGGDDKKTGTATTTPTSNGGFVIISSSTPSTSKPTTTGSNNSSGSNSGTVTRPSTGGGYTRPTGGTSYVPGYVPGNPDLVVTVLEKGIINSAGAFIPTNTFTTSDSVVVKFKVENRGTGSTGTWNLKVTMPSLDAADQVRDITNIGSIPAGLAIEGQAIFDRPRTDNNPTVVITADPFNGVAESNEGNNVASVPLSVSGTNYNGNGNGSVQPDLAIRNIQSGILSGGQFYPTTNLQNSNRVAIRFEVVNNGNNATGPWYFRGELADSPTRIYNSNAEISIPGNSSVIYVVEFDNIRAGNNSVTMWLDPSNYLVESNEGNNTASVSFYR
ncbi:MAG: hypothetical protein RL094_305 [Candidatus Parcubacteria bacterium]|jgi:hypothetical protein